MDPGVEYWVWVAPILNLTTQNCSSSAFCVTYRSVSSPYILPGTLTNGVTYSVTINGRTNGGPGGAGTPSISFVPRFAAAAWKAGKPLGVDLSGVAYGPSTTTTTLTSIFVAVGAGGAIFSSPDAVTWAAAASGVTSNLNAAAYSNTTNGGTFVAAGDGGVMLSSLDTVTWTPRSTATTSNLYGLATNGGGTFVAVGANGTIIASGDGVTWVTAVSGTTNDLFGVTFANGFYVAVGAQGTLLVSTDGLTWQPVASQTTNDLRGVAYGVIPATTTTLATPVLAAVGAAGTLITSADGITWVANPPIVANDFLALTRGSQFVAVGKGGVIYFSTDGTTWQAAASGTTADLKGVTFTSGAGTSPGIGYVAVGAAGVNLTAF
jgi:hypothetical protein